MIKNERQYRLTRGQVDKLSQALRNLQESAKPEDVHPIIRKAEEEALLSQITELDEDIKEYEMLRASPGPSAVITHFEELPRALIRARISKGWSQKDLAERLGLKEQQIQRYEATDYEAASLGRLREIARALELTVSEETQPTEPLALSELLRRLRSIGIEWDPLIRRVIPTALLVSRAQDNESDEEANLLAAHSIASRLSRVFGWSSDDVLQGRSLELNPVLLYGTKFKIPRRVDQSHLIAYTLYAYYLARVTAHATADLASIPIPRSADKVREQIESRYGPVSFATTLKYVWDLGVRVLPLHDRGALHGACWRIDGSIVVVLNQTNTLPSLWLFDLLHELWHAGEELDYERIPLLEVEEDWETQWSSSEEQAAGQFAGDVILAGRAEELARACVQGAAGSVERLKRAVLAVAERERVPVGGLANYMAFRLSLQGINWWGAARNLQEEGDAWAIARDALLERMDLRSLEKEDQELLLQALRDPTLEVDYAIT